jgi:hypothetical protein
LRWTPEITELLPLAVRADTMLLKFGFRAELF